ncbi:MAG TPA: adenylate/guanylate cyclase domain-containing protein [Candidatus Wunengus sp. YC60]|uniref:adenylate/guanylate cyclase domain-containing protein n=1 Tax=Candidatus Wunengus sp. YC60 TaxID=3367697 RepID=UPI004028BB97
MNTPIQNPFIIFETHLKDIHKLLSGNEVSQDNLPMVQNTFWELLKSYQALKNETARIEKSKKEMESLVKIGKAINSVLDMDRLLNLIMDMVIKVVGAERGFLMLKDKETGELLVKVARNIEEELKDDMLYTISSGITSRVAREGKAILSTDAQIDERFYAQASVMDHNLRSLMCVPLKVKEEIIGIIYVDNRMVSGAFTEESVELLATFANQAAISIENARLFENVVNETKMRMNLQRYLSPNIANDIITKKEKIVLGGERVECSILFADICGFTSIAARFPPERIVNTLNEYFSAMAKIIFGNQGTLDKFIGDCVMALFGAPIFTPYSARNAVKTGLDMLRKLEELQKKWESGGNPSFSVRIGINTGEVIAGNIGSPDRMDYTVIGDNANLASRIESYAKPMTVLVSESTYIKIKDVVVAKKMKPILVKGKSWPVTTYEIISIQSSEEKGKNKRRFVRKNVSTFATFKITSNSKTNQCIIQNISAGGLLISSRAGVPVGEKILLDFTLPDNSIFGGIEGKVVQSSPFKDKQSSSYFKIGIEFTSLNNTHIEKISNFTANQTQSQETYVNL